MRRWLSGLGSGTNRRIQLLETAVRVSHAVGSTLDPTAVFREVFRQVRSVVPVDAFFVATANAERTRLEYRFLVDASQELEPTERVLDGTLAGHCIKTGEPILLSDVEADRDGLGIPRQAWGTVEERSVMVAPLRLRDQVIGAISAQSVHRGAYGPSDLELLQDIAGEAAIAIERADLHERTARLSKRLFDLHRVGVELVSLRDTTALARRLGEATSTLLGGNAAVYLDHGGDDLVRADGKDLTPRIPKTLATTARALAGETVEVTDPEMLAEPGRGMLLASGHRSVMVQPLRAANETVGVLYVAWPEPRKFSDEERELTGILAGIGASALRSVRLYGDLEEAYLSTVTTLTVTIQAREGYGEDHLRRVAGDAVALGQRLALGESELRALRYASLFHSIGKIAVPASVLAKTEALSPEERRMIQEHPVLGAQIIASIGFLQDVAPVVRHASERWDGSGYPMGLAGEAIPRLARILAIVVAYHAMLVDRPYRAALPSEAALAELRAGAGRAYDPALVAEFATMIAARGAVAEVEQELAGARELAILSEITPQFHALLDLQQLLERVLAVLVRRLPGTRLAIMLEEPVSGDLLLRASAGTWSSLPRARVPRGSGLAGWVMTNRETQLVEDVKGDPRWISQDDTRSALIVPLLAGGRGVGVLGLLSTRVGAFGQRDATLMQAVSAQLAAAIEVAGLHERLKLAANTDALTGIHNYRYFWDRLQEELSRAERRGTELSVAYFDVNGLKRVNDRYGHLAGDAVLRTLGRVIGTHVRGEDVPARYGGDEFAVVMPETPRAEAEKAVRRLMDLVDATDVELEPGRTIPMPSRGWGVATYPHDARTAKELVESADKSAYALKRAR